MSRLEDQLLLQIRAVGLPAPEREVTGLIPGRRFRVDFCWRQNVHRLVVELDGGVWMGKSRHTSGAGFTRDAEKTNLLTLAGWRVLRVTGEQVRSGQALGWIEQGLRETA
jgi:very-short-patch-repair endonuclease